MKRNDKIRYVTPKQAYQYMTRGAQQIPVTPNDAARALFGAEKSRQEMLARHGIQSGSESASAAREKMIKQRQKEFN